MKKTIYLILSSLALFSCTQPQSTSTVSEPVKPVQESSQYSKVVIDTIKSQLNWKGTKPTGDEHIGTVAISSGTLLMENQALVGGQFVIDMNSILVTDEDMSNKGKNKLKRHLTNGDFFETDQFPEAKLAITSTTADSLTANLEIKGINQSITIPYSLSQEGNTYRITSTFSIDRTRWGITFHSSGFIQNLGDYLIDDAIQFGVELTSKT